jgi:hypothetical protein
LLFLQRRDWPAWVGLIVTGLGLTLIGTAPSDLPGRLADNLDNIRFLGSPGGVNDYSFAGPYHDDILSPDHWLYCLGLRDRTAIAVLQGLVVAALLAWLATDLLSGRLAPDSPTALALVCVFSCLFLYHRVYDTVILTLPLMHACNRARQEYGWHRAAYALVVIGFLAVLNMPRGEPLQQLAQWSQSAGLAGRLVQIVVLPYATWMLFICLLVFRSADRSRGVPKKGS